MILIFLFFSFIFHVFSFRDREMMKEVNSRTIRIREWILDQQVRKLYDLVLSPQTSNLKPALVIINSRNK